MATTKKSDSARFGVFVLMMFLLCMILASFVATQYFAAKLAYQPELGGAVVSFHSGTKLYFPFMWMAWNWKWSAETGLLRTYVTQMQIIALAGGVIAVAIGGWMYYRRSMQGDNHSDLHGSAHFATDDEIAQTKLITHGSHVATGVYCGSVATKWGKMALRHDGPEHVIVFAPTRSGKGVGLVLPTLYSWEGSCVVHDIKGENWALTAGFRQAAGQKVLKFEPTCTDGSGARFNPLAEVRLFTTSDVKDAQNIASMIVDPEGKGLEDHWAKTSFALLAGVILHVMYSEKDKSLGGVAFYLSDPSFSHVDQMFLRMVESEHDPEGKMGWRDSSGLPTKTHPLIASEAQAMLNKDDKEKSSVLSTALSFLTIFKDAALAMNTSESDFTIDDLMMHDSPVSLYLVVPPSDKARLRPLIRLVINQIVSRRTERMDFANGSSVAGYKHRLLLLIDEFPALGKLDIVAEGLAFMAGYGLKAYLITQDLAQLQDAYGQNESIVSNCHVRIAYAPNRFETAKLLSDMCGVSTVTHESRSYSGGRLGPMLGQVSVSEQLTQRPLLTPDECMTLPSDDSLIFMAGYQVIRGKKLKYYEIPEFDRRSKIPAPAKSDTCRDAALALVPI